MFKKKSFWVVLLLFVGTVLFSPILSLSARAISSDGILRIASSDVKPAIGKPVIGAIRWDAWYTGGPGFSDEISLTPPQWHDRLPFYTTFSATGSPQVRLDTQAQMDQEIAAAKAGGLDYWAFDFYGNTVGLTGALNKYLNSSHKADLKFALVLTRYNFTQDSSQDWNAQAINYFKDPQYQTVLNGRPLLYVFEHNLGVTKDTVDRLRKATIAAGIPNPYIVLMTFNANTPKLDEFGFDAVSSYAQTPTGTNGQVGPYSNLSSVDEQFWNTAKSLGRKVVPIVMTGWDTRARVAHPPPWQADITATPVAIGTPVEIASHLSSAINWVAANPTSADSNTIIIYAWNEFAEGGWLDPLLDGGSARLDAIRQVLGGTQIVSADFKKGDRVVTTDGVNVRGNSTLKQRRQGTQPAGAKGTVVDGPEKNDGHIWWKIDFDTGADGWVAGIYLAPLSQDRKYWEIPPPGTTTWIQGQNIWGLGTTTVGGVNEIHGLPSGSWGVIPWTGINSVGIPLPASQTNVRSDTPIVNSLSPLSGPVGSSVVISGTSFASSGNLVRFGISIIKDVAFVGGTLQFTVPAATYLPCFDSVPRCLAPSAPIMPGVYSVSVTTPAGTSNSIDFTVTAGSASSGGGSSSISPAPAPRPLPSVGSVPPPATGR